ncbi:MAG: YdcF family protein, partial [Chitinophagaceae bacterium]
FKQAAKTDWKKYPATAMLVPGLGPQRADIRLDPGAARRCELAANRFKKGEAPFIIVSGGHVHPPQTPYNEAIEMRKYLVNELKIPASAVIIEPHARHTITNIRNAARLIYLFGMPADKPVKIVSDDLQSAYIFMLKGRFMTELGYLPYKGLNRDPTGAPLFYPDLSCFKRNPYDPLDP